MPDFKAKMYQIQSQTPLGELTALPQTSKLDLRGLLLRRGRGGEGKRGGEAPNIFSQVGAYVEWFYKSSPEM